MSIFEPDFEEPALTYWRPQPQPQTAAALLPLALRQRPPGTALPSYTSPGFCYPITNVVHSFVQNQQIQLSEQGGQERGRHRRMAQSAYGQTDPGVLMSAFSSASYTDQSGQTVADYLIQDEVTRAAKTLFNKRNRTLLHWLNPNVSKNQLKIDVDNAWKNLPPAEKVFYISQVLGKFAPHMTSLMVNPHLNVNQGNSVTMNTEREDLHGHTHSSNDSGRSSEVPVTNVNNCCSPESKVKTTQVRNKTTKNPLQKQKIDYCSDETSCNSGLIIDIDVTEQPRVKRKYTKRKHKVPTSDSIECKAPTSDSTTCKAPTSDSTTCKAPTSDSTACKAPTSDLTACKTSTSDSTACKAPTNESTTGETKSDNLSSAVPVDVNVIKVEPNTEPVPRVKRKYVKRKLERKKYKKREPKKKPVSNCILNPQVACNQASVDPLQDSLTSEDMDLWIDLGDGNLLLDEEVDSFWGNIGDPKDLFMDLEIELNIE